jgi:hypothetical protein
MGRGENIDEILLEILINAIAEKEGSLKMGFEQMKNRT